MTETARVYGASLYGLAQEERAEERVLNELSAAARIFRENPDYESLMNLPSVPKEERIACIDKAFGGKVHTYIVNFLKLLTERGIISQLSGCLEAYTAAYNEDKGIIPVNAVAASELDASEIAALKKKLESVTGKTIQLTVSSDPSLLGGLRFTMDGKLYDGTVRSRLAELEKSLRGKTL